MKKMVHTKPGGKPIKVLWSGLRPFYDYWGNELKRFYQFDTLVNSLNTYLHGKDKFILPSIQKVLGLAPITSLKFHLFQEGKYQFIFRLKAENQKLKCAYFAFVVAKDGDDFSNIAKAEHQLLLILNKKSPDLVVKPFSGDYLFFPDRYNRKEFHRKIYAYLTQWLEGFEELGVNRDLQFFTNVQNSHTFSIKETNQIKIKIIETIVSLYDEKKKISIALPEIASGDFVIKRSPSGNHRLKLIACRKTLKPISPPELIAKIITTSWRWGNKKFHLLPDEPQDFLTVFLHVVGNEKTALWFNNLWTQEEKLIKHPVVPQEYIKELKKLSTLKTKELKSRESKGLSNV
ncbi:MAG TPA: hypothetical protein PLX23_02445 [Candidatus Hydrogenedens sp.]|nr:hypothetical protein [Candidatus Hydrogenedens sp.]